jgi:hypothetical protein
MTENAIPAGTSDALRATSVADYIVQRSLPRASLTVLGLLAIMHFRSAMRSTEAEM